MEFIESFMKFSFNDDDAFRIEEDELIKNNKSVKACECVVLISENVALIEAKSSTPRIDNEEKFSSFMDDIRKKFADSLQLFCDIKSKKCGDEAFDRLPTNLRKTELTTDAYKICLVIHGHKFDWLLGLIDALKNVLREEVKKWNMRDSNIKVFNEETAKENSLIVAYVPRAECDTLRQENGNADPVKVKEWFDNHP